ncbi:protein root UVB sensitive 2, chloroplastic [Iris pallida]|uniref:Protein root UVB sensitive 2, chloroplastic n=1 Tax=Iris pallida TaxID=29817 RepID=A0AAX6F8G1_IRIPA|nr:protein root UVB sensitive 2, chloroplastic [Iris pallida]
MMMKKEDSSSRRRRASYSWWSASSSRFLDRDPIPSHPKSADSARMADSPYLLMIRGLFHKVVESFLNKFFPSGYPYSVNEGYLTYSRFRALQHFTSAALSVLSTQSLLFAAGLRATPAQATAVSWVLKDGMQHGGKLICSGMGARMDSEPKSWRILADVLYDLGTGLEVVSPLCPQFFLELAGLGNFAKGMAVVAARATRLPIYSSFAKEGNLSDLFAKGEAISTLFNVLGIGVGIQLASTVCSSIRGS